MGPAQTADAAAVVAIRPIRALRDHRAETGAVARNESDASNLAGTLTIVPEKLVEKLFP